MHHSYEKIYPLYISRGLKSIRIYTYVHLYILLSILLSVGDSAGGLKDGITPIANPLKQ